MMKRKNVARVLVGACGPVALVGWVAASPASAYTGTTSCPGGTVSAGDVEFYYAGNNTYGLQGKGTATCSGTWQVTAQIQQRYSLNEGWHNYGSAGYGTGAAAVSIGCTPGIPAFYQLAVKATSGGQSYGITTNLAGPAGNPISCS